MKATIATFKREPAGASGGKRLFFASAAPAFTLIELILILALLAIATSVAAPSLSNFFKGQSLRSEARQLLSLVHAGQSRAVSGGFPALLWIDTPGRSYGLLEENASPSADSPANDKRAEEFAFNEDLQIEAIDAAPLLVNGRSLPAIRFLPDGTVDESSLKTVRLTARNGDMLWLVQATNRLSYAISDINR